MQPANIRFVIGSLLFGAEGSNDFKIGFLRTERYHARKSAHRLLGYLKKTLELFGPEKLTSDITCPTGLVPGIVWERT